MPRSTIESLQALSKQLFTSKLDELKDLIFSIPFEAKMFFNNNCISILDGLYTFCRLEKAYYSTQFLAPGFLLSRRENYEASYRALHVGFDQIADVAVLDQPSQEYRTAMFMKNICLVRARLISSYPFKNSSRRLDSRVIYFSQYIGVIVLLAFTNYTSYRAIDENPLKLLTECATLCTSVESWEQELSVSQDEVSSALAPIDSSMRTELRLFANLLRVQSHIANLKFIDSLLSLSTACSDLHTIYRSFGLQFIRGPRSTPKPPALLSWLSSFYNVLLAKYTLYWFNVLRDSVADSSEVLEITSSEDPSLVTRLIGFQNRTNALYCSIFFDTSCQNYPYLGHGFVLPGTAGDAPTGVKSFPPIFTTPLGFSVPVAEISSTLMQISGKINTGEPSEFNKLLYSFDEKLNHTYFIQKLEYRFYILIVYDGYRSRKDRQISEFLSSFLGQIRLTTLSSSLRSV